MMYICAWSQPQKGGDRWYVRGMGMSWIISVFDISSEGLGLGLSLGWTTVGLQMRKLGVQNVVVL